MEIDVSAPAVLQHPAVSFAPSSDQPPLVLVVDDDPAIRLLCSVNLQLEGLSVLEASDVPGALAQARSTPPDLVVTDIMMPGLDGFQLAAELRRDERTHRVPVIFLSGETGAANEARAAELGALAYITKPFDPAELVALVTVALARSDQGVDARREAC